MSNKERQFTGKMFSNTETIDKLLLKYLNEGYFDDYLQSIEKDKDVIIEQLNQAIKDDCSVIQEVYTLGSDEMCIEEFNGISNDEKEFLNSLTLLDNGAGFTEFDSLTFISVESADRVAEPTKDNPDDRMLYCIGFMLLNSEGKMNCYLKSFM